LPPRGSFSIGGTTVSLPPVPTTRCSTSPRRYWLLSESLTAVTLACSAARINSSSGKLDVKFHRWLIDGQDIRNVGDYGVGTEVSSDQAVEVISQAEEFIRAGQACLRDEG